MIATMRKVGISKGDVTTRADHNETIIIQKQCGEVCKDWGWPDAEISRSRQQEQKLERLSNQRRNCIAPNREQEQRLDAEIERLTIHKQIATDIAGTELAKKKLHRGHAKRPKITRK